MTPTPLPSGLIVIHSNLSESLRDVLVGWLDRHPLGPLEQEVVLVQSSGIAQWLKLALAADAADGGSGIAAGLDFLLPSRFLWRAYRIVLGTQAVPEVSPFDKPRLMWRLLRLLPQVMEQPAYAPLQRFLRRDDDCRKRYQLAERLADLFDQYQVYRADWLDAWSRGQDVLPRDRGPALPLPDAQRWQAALWRALLDDVLAQAAQAEAAGAAFNASYVAPSSDGRAAVHAAFMRRAEQLGDTAPPDLPRRIVVFGISTLPRQSLEVLAVLARWTQVLMCVSNPCEHYWADIIEGKDLLRASHARQARRAGAPAVIGEDALHLHAHPLLAAWGKQGRDFIGLLDEHDSQEAREAFLSRYSDYTQRLDLFQPVADEDATLLRQLQDDIRDLRPLKESRALWPPVDPTQDRSIRFHVAHSRQREVEILHDQLLAAFDEDPTLRARDVIVMVPDIEAYAPHVQAVFGLYPADDRRAIPYTLADRGKRHVDPLLHALEHLLQLPYARFAVSDLMDLLEVPALRRRYGIEEDQLPLLHNWMRGANIRWGLHDEQRRSLGLPGTDTAAAPNTWLFGLRRVLLGYAVGARGGDWQGIEPYGDVGGLDAALLGNLAELVAALESWWRELAEPASPERWGERLRELLQAFFEEDDSVDGLVLRQLRGQLQTWLEICAEAQVTEPLPLAVVGEHWMSAMDEGGLTQRFFGGAVTFATLMPMRAIPFRHVCLLGMNDGDYPRVRIPMDFDLMGRDYRPGDRSRREDDRYLFLEALLSARDRLYVSWIGRSVRDNTPRPPSVLVGQLRDHLDAGWELDCVNGDEDDGASADHAGGVAAALTVEHRLQPFSPDYFPADPRRSTLFTYAREWGQDAVAGARDCRGDGSRDDDRGRAGAFDAEPEAKFAAGSLARLDPLPPLVREEPLSLRELAAFLKAPVEAFFRQRLQVSFNAEDVVAEDIEPFAPDALETWQLQDRLIKAQARALEAGAGSAPARDDVLAACMRAGELPAGAFGELAAADLAAPLDEMMERYAAALANWRDPVEGELAIRFDVPAGRYAADMAGAPTAVGAAAAPPTATAAAWALGDNRLSLEDYLGGLRANAAGDLCRLVLESSSLVPKGRYRADKVVSHWVAHVAAQLSGRPITTLVISKAGDIEFAPVAAERARAWLALWLGAWEAGMRRPLPLAVGAAFEWLTRLPEEADQGAVAAADSGAGPEVARHQDGAVAGLAHDPDDALPAAALTGARAIAWQQARKVYEGAPMAEGEVDRSAYLQAVYPDFTALTRGGEFQALARALLRPMRAALYAESRPKKTNRSGDDNGQA
ncbi:MULTISPECIES: exodeoxyribonuclease V subunit gamma [unclassified Achromobacter]|uniref:exodeoxyribonuclease V subunit gamma n=1 Tax=unclassified Achromobacter TaxID=2626865 RepID=UPI000B517C2D|nr:MULTISPECIES: exodeoxyribonuclease V subunit gamma [unclassified Achromobacter]OWT74566.1 exodeoxyribonuclease V subunit gamma [Achromobacter sp. HZ34]OWT79033.1 exodeoxyribonuclease V subunit gamma [Achromobacter sp. HZ28]